MIIIILMIIVRRIYRVEEDTGLHLLGCIEKGNKILSRRTQTIIVLTILIINVMIIVRILTIIISIIIIIKGRIMTGWVLEGRGQHQPANGEERRKLQTFANLTTIMVILIIIFNSIKTVAIIIILLVGSLWHFLRLSDNQSSFRTNHHYRQPIIL